MYTYIYMWWRGTQVQSWWVSSFVQWASGNPRRAWDIGSWLQVSFSHMVAFCADWPSDLFLSCKLAFTSKITQNSTCNIYIYNLVHRYIGVKIWQGPTSHKASNFQPFFFHISIFHHSILTACIAPLGHCCWVSWRMASAGTPCWVHVARRSSGKRPCSTTWCEALRRLQMRWV